MPNDIQVITAGTTASTSDGDAIAAWRRFRELEEEFAASTGEASDVLGEQMLAARDAVISIPSFGFRSDAARLDAKLHEIEAASSGPCGFPYIRERRDLIEYLIDHPATQSLGSSWQVREDVLVQLDADSWDAASSREQVVRLQNCMKILRCGVLAAALPELNELADFVLKEIV